MQTKSGELVPEELAQVLVGEPGIRDIWQRLPASSQLRYVEQLEGEKEPQQRKRLLALVLRRILDQGERDFERFGKRGIGA